MTTITQYSALVSPVAPPTKFPLDTNNYEEVLQFFELVYQPVSFYLQVGKIPWVQGWILHISVIMSQLNELLEKVLPLLIEEKVAFKVVRDRDTNRDLLDGHLGYTQLGKSISIYPENGAKAHLLARKLILLTVPFKGPKIPTDIHLGGQIYTRYGNGNPIIMLDALGKPEKFIYDHKDELICDSYSIPFVLPEGIRWPFEGIASANSPKIKNTFKNTYRPISLLKSDPRGNVWKAVYLKGFLRTSVCVIKQGNNSMCADQEGRDVSDRLHWQYKLHKELEGIVPLPKIFELFEEGGNTYLAMEHIKGISLEEWIRLVNGNTRAWLDLSLPQRLAIVDCILSIIRIVQNLHAKGYVHRDIQPANFLIDPKGQIYLIDIELAYSLKEGQPAPPFGLGTPGCMSPEQFAGEIPTIKEDIYGLSATMLMLLIGMHPIKFNAIHDTALLEEDIDFFIRDRKMARLIAAGMNQDASLRPELTDLLSCVEVFRADLSVESKAAQQDIKTITIDAVILGSIIQGSINSLARTPMAMADCLWLSKMVQSDPDIAILQKRYAIHPGLEEGVAGVLYLLARAKTVGWEVGDCMISYRKGWDFLQASLLSKLPNIPPGLYGGAAGLAIALAEGMKAGLLKDNLDSRKILQACLELEPTGLDLASGMAGQGIALLQCISLLPGNAGEKILTQYVQKLMQYQQKDGSWIMPLGKKVEKEVKSPSFPCGVSGITWFLLEYLNHYPEPQVRKSIERSMKWLDKLTDQLKKPLNPALNKAISGQDPVVREGGTGVLLTYLKAYEVLAVPAYKKVIKDSLLANPPHIIYDDFSQAAGLAGLGELYLEAGRVLQDPQWKLRAEWIAELFMHSCVRRPEGIHYWAMTQNSAPTADFMMGNSGVIHFLIRCLAPNRLGYRILQ